MAKPREGATVSRAEFARLMGVSSQMVGKWMRAGMPYRSTGRKGVPVSIPFRQAHDWLVAEAIEKEIGARPGDDERRRGVTSARADLVHWQAERARLDALERQGELVAVEFLEMVALEVARLIAASHDGAAGRIAAGDRVLRARALAEMHRVRTNIADRLRAYARAVPQGAPHERSNQCR